MDNTKTSTKTLYIDHPPVVSVLGHVDHGKTTLLDALRKTDKASGEHGGITQAIGASEIEISHNETLRKITFIDTPGHEAFSNMRRFGVSAADIALLIVAADDGVMPQTRESIKLLQDAKLPFIVVITKKDIPGANIEKAKQSILREKILLEGVGGDVPYIAVSAKSGEGIPDLLDLILLVYDVSGIKKDEKADFSGVIIESKLDKKRGPLSTVIVKNGILSQGEKLYQQEEIGKSRALVTSHGKTISKAIPGDAVEILGIKNVLQTGSLIYTRAVKSESHPLPIQAPIHSITAFPASAITEFLKDEKKESKLKIVLKTEGEAELNAIKNSLPEGIQVVYEGQGDIVFSDVHLAKDFGAIVIGFRVNIAKDAKILAENERVFYKTYNIIYELLDEVSDAMLGIIEQKQERTLGEATIQASFPSKDTTILGIKVLLGRIANNDSVKLMRGDKELGRSKIISVKRGKQEVKEVAKNLECGIILSPFLDFQVGDMLLSYNK